MAGYIIRRNRNLNHLLKKKSYPFFFFNFPDGRLSNKQKPSMEWNKRGTGFKSAPG